MPQLEEAVDDISQYEMNDDEKSEAQIKDGSPYGNSFPNANLRSARFGRGCPANLALAMNGTPSQCVKVFYVTPRKMIIANGKGDRTSDREFTTGFDDSERNRLGYTEVVLPLLEGRCSTDGEEKKGLPPCRFNDRLVLTKNLRSKENSARRADILGITLLQNYELKTFQDQLATAAIAANPKSPAALVYVHGRATSFDSAVVTAAQVAIDLSFKDNEPFAAVGDSDAVYEFGQPVVFSWPHADAVNPFEYDNDRDNAIKSAKYLVDFINLLGTNGDIKTINIIFHSMGNYVYANKFDELQQRLSEMAAQGKTINLLHFAGDASHKAYQRAAIPGVSAKIYTSSKDSALKWSIRSKWDWKPIDRKCRIGLKTGDCPPIDTNYAETIDVSGAGADGWKHGYNENIPQILSDAACSLRGEEGNRAIEHPVDSKGAQQSYFQMSPQRGKPHCRALDLRPQLREKADDTIDAVRAWFFRNPKITVCCFSSGSDGDDGLTMDEDAIVDLNNLLLIAKEKKWRKIIFDGYTDTRGDKEKNIRLSQKRAELVAQHVRNFGFDEPAFQINPEGSNNSLSGISEYGEKCSEPNVRCRRNRRVEVKFVP